MNGIITIGREFGSEGRELGIQLSQKLNVAYYERELVTEIAKRTHMSEKYVTEVMEYRPQKDFPISMADNAAVLADNVLMQQKMSISIEMIRIVREVAAKGNCVIIGRCADYILEDFSPFRIFVYASLEDRIARRLRIETAEGAKITLKEMQKKVPAVDRIRADHYRKYTGKTWDDPNNYDMMINTTGREVDEISTRLARFFRESF